MIFLNDNCLKNEIVWDFFWLLRFFSDSGEKLARVGPKIIENGALGGNFGSVEILVGGGPVCGWGY